MKTRNIHFLLKDSLTDWSNVHDIIMYFTAGKRVPKSTRDSLSDYPLRSYLGKSIKDLDEGSFRVVNINDLTAFKSKEASSTFNFIFQCAISSYLDALKHFQGFLLIKETTLSAKLCFDTTEIQDHNERNSTYYPLNHFLWDFHGKNVFYNRYYDIETGEIRISEIRRPIAEKQRISVLHRLTPLITLDKPVYIDIFETTLKNKFESDCENISITGFQLWFESLDKNQFPVENEEDPIVNFLWRKCIIFLKEIRNSKTKGYLLEAFKMESILALYLTVIYIENESTLRNLIKSKNPDYQHVGSVISLIKEYTLGLREIAENIVIHSDDSRGYFYVRIFSKEDLLKDVSKFKRIKGYEKQIENTKLEHNSFFQIELFDFSEKGILNTYSSRESSLTMAEESQHTPDLVDFFAGDFERFNSLSKLDFRHLARLGLKTFANIVIDNCGLLRVSTVGSKGNDVIIYTNLESALKFNKRMPLGTSYYILIPVISFDYVADESSPMFQAKSLHDFFEKWVFEYEEPRSFYVSDILKYSLDIYSDKYYYIERASEDIIDKINNVIEVLVFDYSMLLERVKDLSIIIKIVAFIQLKQRVKNIVFYNVDKKFIFWLRRPLSVFRKSGVIWNNDMFLYMYDEEGVPLIVTGRTIERLRSINEKVWWYYGRNYRIGEDTNGEKEDVYNDQVQPFEVLSINNKRRTFFEDTVSKAIDRKYGDDHLGIKIENTHMRLGSSIHIENFYEANFLFQNSYYVDRFAYLLSKNLKKSLEGETRRCKVILIGYGEYSQMLLSKIKYTFDSFDTNVGTVLDFFLCKNLVSYEWSDETKFELLNTETIQSLRIAIVVPISSTLSTNRLIFNEFCKRYKSISNQTIDEDSIILNSSVFLIRDRIHKESTDNEKYLGWQDIDTYNRLVYTDFFSTPIQYCIEKEGGWSIPLTCSKCYPDLYGDDGIVSDEVAINETNEVSIIPKTVFYREKADFMDISSLGGDNSRISHLSDSIKYGHINGSTVHHNYYIDTREVFKKKENVLSIKKWLSGIKSNLIKDFAYHNVIISIKNNTNSHFINLVKDEVFGGAVSHISLDLDKKLDNNYLVRHYLNFKNLKKVRFHFCADVLSTGTSLETAINYLFPLINKLQLPDKQLFSNIIILVNRLGHSRIREIQSKYLVEAEGEIQIQSFVNLLTPPVNSLEYDCYKCEEQKKNEWIYHRSVLQPVRSFFKKRVVELNVIESSDIQKIEFKRFYERMKIAHELTSNLMSTSGKAASVINEFESSLETDPYSLVNFYKVVSQPPYTILGYLKNQILALLLRRTDYILSLDQSDVSLYDFNLLIICIKRLSYYKSNFLIRQRSIDRIWNFFAKVNSNYSFLQRLSLFSLEQSRSTIKMIHLGILIENKRREFGPKASLNEDKIRDLLASQETIRSEVNLILEDFGNHDLYELFHSAFGDFYTDTDFTNLLEDYLTKSVKTIREDCSESEFVNFVESCLWNDIIKTRYQEIQKIESIRFLSKNYRKSQLGMVKARLKLIAVYFLKDLFQDKSKNQPSNYVFLKTLNTKRDEIADARDELRLLLKTTFFEEHQRNEVQKFLVQYLDRDLKPFVREFVGLDSDLPFKTYRNFRQFSTLMVSVLKRAICDDESKSFRYSYLTGFGKEYSLKEIEAIEYKHVPYNSYFNFPTKLSLKQVKNPYFDFKVSINLENLYVHQNCFENLEREPLVNSILRERIKKIFPDFPSFEHFPDFQEIYAEFVVLIRTDRNYRYISTLSNDSELKKLFLAFILRLYLHHYISIPNLEANIGDFIQTITEFLSHIMEADYAFLCIRRFKHFSDRHLYVIGRYSKNGLDTEQEIPFELDSPAYFTHRYVNKKGPNQTFEIHNASPRVKPAIEFPENIGNTASDLFGLNLFLSEVSEAPSSPIGGITFVHEVEDVQNRDKTQRRRAEIKEYLKYVLLIINDLQSFLEAKFDNENFNNWIDIARVNRVYEIRNNKFQHNAWSQSEELVRLTQGNMRLNTLARLINSDLFIGHQFSSYVSGRTLRKGELDPILLKRDLFNKDFKSILQNIPLRQHINSLTIKVEPKGLDSTIWADLEELKDIVVLLVDNAVKHGDRKTPVRIYFDSPCLVIENTVPENQFIKFSKEVDLLKDKMTAEKCLSGGITLFTLNKYFEQNYKRKLELDIGKDYISPLFKIKIPLLPDEISSTN